MQPAAKHPLVALDVNASRARAVGGTHHSPPQAVLLDGPHDDLPLFLSLEGRAVEVGRVGAALCRRLPHLACHGFLSDLGNPRTWTGNGHKLDAADAVKAVLKRLRPAFAEAGGVTVSVPAYLDSRQTVLLRGLFSESWWPVLGLVSAPLAVALAAHAEQPWSGSAFVLDVDEHALTWSAVLGEDGQARVVEVEVKPELGLRAWKGRLLNALADRCVRQSRRDPRDSAGAEQTLYDQFDHVLAMSRSGRTVEIAVQGPQWYQNLILQPDDLTAFCSSLVKQTLESMRRLQARVGLPGAVLVTATAGRLPGLTGALDEAAKPNVRPEVPSSDWGEDLFDGGALGSGLVHVLGEDAAARAALALAVKIDQGAIAAGTVEVAPLPPPQPVDAGPPRLHFHGQDFVLCGLSFLLGRHPSCDLVFDTDQFPTVSAKHCEIVFENRQYLVRDASKHGTLVNDRPVIKELPLHPGDWVRLGPNGPLLRFLGHATDQKKRMTTA